MVLSDTLPPMGQEKASYVSLNLEYRYVSSKKLKGGKAGTKKFTLSRTQPPATRSCVPRPKWRTTSRSRRKICSSFSVSSTVSFTTTLRGCCSGKPAAMPEYPEKARTGERKKYPGGLFEGVLRRRGESAGERRRRGGKRPPRGRRRRRRGGMWWSRFPFSPRRHSGSEQQYLRRSGGVRN